MKRLAEFAEGIAIGFFAVVGLSLGFVAIVLLLVARPLCIAAAVALGVWLGLAIYHA